MTDKPRVTMSSDELALDLLTTGQSMTGGRAEAERLLRQIKDRHARQLGEKIRKCKEYAGHVTVAPQAVREILEWAALEIDPDPQPTADPFCGSSFAPGPHPSHRYMRGGKGYTCPGESAPAAPSAPADADLRDRIRRAICEASGFTWLPDELMEPDEYGEHADAVLAVIPPSAYRRLLARLEADRASHLRATVRAKGAGADEVLVAVGGTFASAFRFAAAMAVRAFEGPDAAQAYMQRTEGGEEDPPFDVEAGLQRLADDLQRGEAGDGPAPGRAPTDAERRDRYSVAIHEADGWVLDGGQHMLDAVIAVADTEQADLRALILDYENRITWDTTCGSCARILDSGNRERERAERSEAALDQVRAVISEIDTEMRTEPDTQRSAMQMETVTRIGAAIGDVAPGEQADRVLDERVAAAKEQPVGLPPQLQAALDVMAKRGRVVELTARRDDPDVVAYRNSDRPGVLLCREHGDGWMGLTPLTSDDLPDGGLCTECGVDVLIPQQQAGDGR